MFHLASSLSDQERTQDYFCTPHLDFWLSHQPHLICTQTITTTILSAHLLSPKHTPSPCVLISPSAASVARGSDSQAERASSAHGSRRHRRERAETEGGDERQEGVVADAATSRGRWFVKKRAEARAFRREYSRGSGLSDAITRKWNVKPKCSPRGLNSAWLPMSKSMCGCGCSIISSLMKRLGRSACCSDLLSCSHTSEQLQRLATGCPPRPSISIDFSEHMRGNGIDISPNVAVLSQSLPPQMSASPCQALLLLGQPSEGAGGSKLAFGDEPGTAVGGQQQQAESQSWRPRGTGGRGNASSTARAPQQPGADEGDEEEHMNRVVLEEQRPAASQVNSEGEQPWSSNESAANGPHADPEQREEEEEEERSGEVNGRLKGAGRWSWNSQQRRLRGQGVCEEDEEENNNNSHLEEEEERTEGGEEEQGREEDEEDDEEDMDQDSDDFEHSAGERTRGGRGRRGGGMPAVAVYKDQCVCSQQPGLQPHAPKFFQQKGKSALTNVVPAGS
ncbi:hypothetical protein WMY93_005536 [Mugilogobius chulae]|uniref:Uncharacterized protein n=1 Tax=Mugilogobius chulae TaxID=88201 RepID=A0AAW0PTF2_9GOBI